MPDLPSGPMTVVALEVDSFKRIQAASLTPTPTGLIPVRGKNRAGKSSLLGSMSEALGIDRSKEPITEGEHAGETKVDLGEIVVRRKWTRDSGGKPKSKLVVETAEGVPYKSPQGILDNLVGQFADPVAFEEMKPADQVRTVLRVLGIEGTLEALEERAAGHFDRRRDLGRDADQARTVYAAVEAECVDLPPMKPAARTLDVMTAELAAGEEANRAVDDVAEEKIAAQEAGEFAKREIADFEARIAEYQGRLAEWKEKLEGARERYRQADSAEKATTRVDLAPIREEIAGYEATLAGQAKRERLVETRNAHHAAAQAHKAEEEKLEEVREEIATLLGEAPFPVEGMSYDHEAKVLTVNGVPFSQASQGERLRLAARIAMSGNPAIRILFVREGSLLDTESQLILAEEAEAAGFQFWIEIVDEPDPETGKRRAGIWIEEGEAFVVEAESAE